MDLAGRRDEFARLHHHDIVFPHRGAGTVSIAVFDSGLSRTLCDSPSFRSAPSGGVSAGASRAFGHRLREVGEQQRSATSKRDLELEAQAGSPPHRVDGKRSVVSTLPTSTHESTGFFAIVPEAACAAVEGGTADDAGIPDRLGLRVCPEWTSEYLPSAPQQVLDESGRA